MSTTTSTATLTTRERWSVLGMFLGVFAVGIDSFVISPLLNPMAVTFHASVARVALGVTTYAIAYAVAAPLLAPLGDRHQPARVAMVGMVLFAVATAATSVQSTLVGFYLVRAVAGVGGAMYTPNVQAHVSRRYEPATRGKLMGIIMAGLSASIVLGVPLGSWAARILTWRQVFPCVAGLGIIAVVLLAATLWRDSVAAPATVAARSLGSYLRALAGSRVRRSLLATLAWMTAFYGVYTFLGAFLQDRLHINVAQVGTYLMVYGLGNFAATFTAGWVNHRLGGPHRPVLVFGVVNIACVIALTTLPLNPVSVVVIFLLWAAAQGYAATSLIGLAASSAAPEQISTVLALNSAFIYVGLALGSALFGTLVNHGPLLAMGLPAAILTLAAMASAAASRHTTTTQ